MEDLWSTDNTAHLSKNIKTFREYKEKTTTKVKPIVVPHSGQSYNPSSKDHKDLIEKIVEEEKNEVKEFQRRLRYLKPHLFEDQ